MLRVVRTDDKVTLDPGQNLPGRGAYVHRLAECVEAAVKRGGLARTLRCKVGLLEGRLLTGVAAKAPSRSESASKIPKESKDS
jgi:predicted RNA-binding protein YlxR (DUF448 family)